MLFTSPVFLFIFLPVLLALYFLIPSRPIKNTLLLIFSLFFYAWGEPLYILILMTSITANYFFGLLIWENRENQSHQKWMVGLGCTLNLILLGSYKYSNFIIENINSLLAYSGIATLENDSIPLPIGISFFTFQAMSYLIDIYRREGTVQKNPINLALYISLFPQLIAGPIVRYHDIFKQITGRQESVALFSSGVKRFIYGLAKKMMIANPMGYVADQIFSTPSDELSLSLCWLGIICYTLQIYFDFSAYSDMAIGLGRIFGFRLLENFNYPYISTSIQEFWRRWHISLSSWFRDYLYIPLGGNRCSPLRIYLNLVIVFFLCGLWHGASWNFVVWGLYHGFFLSIERAGLNNKLAALWRPVRHIYTLLIVMIGWVFFRAEDLSSAVHYLSVMFCFSESGTPVYDSFYFLDNEIIVVLIIGLIGATPLWKNIDTKLDNIGLNERLFGVVTSLQLPKNQQLQGSALLSIFIAALLGALCLTYVAAQTYNPFIYFRF